MDNISDKWKYALPSIASENSKVQFRLHLTSFGLPHLLHLSNALLLLFFLPLRQSLRQRSDA